MQKEGFFPLFALIDKKKETDMDFATYQNLINQNKQRNDDSITARFYDRAIKTTQFDNNGIPVFKNVCYCEIRIKDNTTEVFDQPADSEKINRFPVEYARYQLLKKQLEEGTPLEKFAFLTASEIETCKYRGIFTIEALAEMTEEKAQNLNLQNEQGLARKFVEFNQNINKKFNLADVETKYKKEISALKAELNQYKKAKNRRK